MATVLHLRVLEPAKDQRPDIHELVADLFYLSRRKSGMDRGQFAEALNDRVSAVAQHPLLSPGAIRAIEGKAPVRADVLLAAMELAGFDVRKILGDLLDEAVRGLG